MGSTHRSHWRMPSTLLKRVVFSCYIWHQEKWKCTNPGIKKTLTAKIKEGITVPLRYLKLYEAMEILGIYLSPDINNH